jgi:hypothetical protein
MVIDQMEKQMSDGNSTCPLDPMDKQNSNGHFQVHWIHWIQWTLSFGYLNSLVSTWCPYACHYVVQIHINWPTEKANVRWNSTCPLDPMDKQNSNGHFKDHWIHWTFSFGHLNGLASVYMMSICLSIRHSNTWQLTKWKSKCPMEIPLIHWIHWTNKIQMDISRSIGSIGSNAHFRLDISMA